MSIHTLHDLCYAYGVADPVREMLFALQDRIDALEAQRQPLTDERILHFVNTHVGGPSPSYPLDNSDWINFARAIEAAHGIKEGT